MLQSIFDWLLGAGKEAALFVISMLPLIELRGAVPLGLATGMPWLEVLPICYLGNLVAHPVRAAVRRAPARLAGNPETVRRVCGKL